MRRRIQRKGRKSRRPMRRRRNMRKRITNANQRHYATITETVQLDNMIANATYYQTFNLAEFYRASAIAPQFKYYRAKKVLWKYEPIYNIYGEGTTADTIPYVVTRMNRSQERILWSAADLKEMGAIPRKFTNSFNLEYKPNWCSPGLQSFYTSNIAGTEAVTDIVTQGTKKNFGYLACPNGGGLNGGLIQQLQSSPLTIGGYNTTNNVSNQVLYNGHVICFEQLIVGEETRVCKVSCTVVWEFIGARAQAEQLDVSNMNGYLQIGQTGTNNGV